MNRRTTWTLARLPFAGWQGRLLLLAVAFRVSFPLAVLAASPNRLLPGLPRYRYNPLEGDAYGYYFGAREILSTWGRHTTTILPVALIALLAVAAVWRLGRGTSRVVAIVLAAGAVTAVICALVRVSGAPQIGWPLVWSLVLLPYRAAGLSLDPDTAFVFGLGLSLLCNAAIVVATYELALVANVRRGIAVIAASLFAFWPLISLLTGPDAAKNGTWQVDLGLSLYTEPLSTALVMVSLVLILRHENGNAGAALGGGLLGLSVLTRLSNVLIAGVVVVSLLIWRERDRAYAVTFTGLAFAPAVALYYPKGYPKLKSSVFPAHPFALGYAGDAWAHSLLWHPAVLVALVPIAILGATNVRPRIGGLLCASVAVTAVFYSFYSFTPIHPRFLFVVLPMVLILWAAGAALITTSVRGLYDRPR